MDEGQEQQIETSAEAPANDSKKPSKWPLVILGGAPVLIPALVFVIVITIVFSLMSLGEPAKNTTGSAGNVNCSDWSGAEPGYQDAITAAANKAKISPALLGAVFLSEHDDSWPKTSINGPWAKGGSAQGPFQIEEWDNKWKNVTGQGLASGSGNPENMYDSGLLTAASLKAGFVNADLIKKVSDDATGLTEQKDVMFAGMWHNRGSKAALEWASGGFDLNNPPPNTKNPGWEWGAHDYAKRTWKNFNGLNVDCTSTSAYGGASDSEVVRIASGEIGYHAPGDCAKYNPNGSCVMWCASFASWVYRQAGYDMPIILSTTALMNYLERNNHTVINYPQLQDLRPGDIFYKSRGGNSYHVGIIKEVKGNVIHTIEGNSSRDFVKYQKQKIEDIRKVGRW